MRSDVDEIEQTETMVLRRLETLGLGNLQARAYISLLRGGPATARTLALRAKISRTDSYRITKALASRGLVKISFSNPNVYEALNPKAALEVLVSELEYSVRKAKEELPELIMSLETLKPSQNEPEAEDSASVITLLRGKSVISAWRHDLSVAQYRVVRFWSSDGVRMNYRHGLFEDYEICANRGVKIRAITEILKSNLYECEEFSNIIQLRHLPSLSGSIRYQIIDGKHIIISSMGQEKDVREMEAVATNNHVLIKGFEKSFEDLWTKAVDAQIRIKEIKSRTVKLRKE
jgi:sugar-specific transcriptional regulator TrmB